MDLLYRAYSNPMTLMCRYINQKRFGKFVHDFFEAEHERRKQEAEKDQEWKLWIAYVMANVSGYYSGTFEEYMKSVMKPVSTTRRRGSDASMTEKDVQSIMDGLFKKE